MAKDSDHNEGVKDCKTEAAAVKSGQGAVKRITMDRETNPALRAGFMKSAK